MGICPPPLDIYALVIIINADADKGPPFILGTDAAGLFRRPKTHNVPYPPGPRFYDFIFPRTCK